MFDHVVFGVGDYAARKSFFVKALEPLGVAIADEGPLGLGLCRGGETSSLCLRQQPEPGPSRLPLAFQASSRAQLRAFHAAALAAGGPDNGAPGLRPGYHPRCDAAFVIGPDGHSIEAVCHTPA